MKFVFIAVVLLMLGSCTSKQTPISQAPLIPKPVSVSDASGSFTLGEQSSVVVSGGSAELLKLGQYLSERLRPATGYALPVAADAASGSSHNIVLEFSGNGAELGKEGYELAVGDSAVHLAASTPAGIFRGIQTLMQLLPDAIENTSKQSGPWTIAAGHIKDFPAYSFRGSMLDVSRHFFTVDQVKHFIDLIAAYKLNVLHLHLSDDQGWRIEIKSWPNLTQHGGSTQVGGGQGGFYTQDQFRDLQQYANDRFITIVPEIDMPGHTNAALASYKVLNCSDTARELYSGTEVGFSTLCVKKDSTYKFIDDVVRELAAITTGPYIHLGGDESHATSKEDYLTFINKIQGMPGKYGKKMIGWEETAQANVDSSSVVQFWTDPQYAEEAARKGAKMILSPASKVYLDMKYDSTTALGLDWAGRVEVDSAYLWSLSTLVKGLPRENILGVEAPLWTETLSKPADIEYMVFPRLPGVAEIGWSPEQGRSWDEYKTRLAGNGTRMQAMHINFYRSKLVPWKQ